MNASDKKLVAAMLDSRDVEISDLVLALEARDKEIERLREINDQYSSLIVEGNTECNQLKAEIASLIRQRGMLMDDREFERGKVRNLEAEIERLKRGDAL